MPLFWFFAGALTMVAAVIVLLPWLRTLSPLPKPASVAAVVVVAAILAASRWLAPGTPGPSATAASESAAKTASAMPGLESATGSSTGSFGTAAKVFGSATGSALATGAPGGSPAAGKAGAGSMDSAIASLEARLAKGGGTPDDWELLAKSFEFLSRPAPASAAA